MSSCLFLWSFLSCHYFFNPVMKSWETFFMLNFIYFHLQIAIVKVLYEIRLLSGKSYRKYRCKWRWCVDSGKLWILDIEVINIYDSWFWINLDYNSSCCHCNLPGKERICSFTRLCQINSTCDVCFIMSLLLQKYDDILWHWLRVEEESYAGMHYLERLCSIIVMEPVDHFRPTGSHMVRRYTAINMLPHDPPS